MRYLGESLGLARDAGHNTGLAYIHLDGSPAPHHAPRRFRSLRKLYRDHLLMGSRSSAHSKVSADATDFIISPWYGSQSA